MLVPQLQIQKKKKNNLMGQLFYLYFSYLINCFYVAVLHSLLSNTVLLKYVIKKSFMHFLALI